MSRDRVPHAELRDGLIFWRGSDEWFRPMDPQTARRLVRRQRLPGPMLADLARAIVAQDEALLEQRIIA